MMRICYALLVVFICFLLGACQNASIKADTQVDTVKVGFFPAAGRYAGFYVASTKGMYAQQGLDVQFVPIYGGEDRSAALKAGEVDLILTDALQVILDQENGADAKIIAIVQAINSVSTFAVKGQGIQTPQDYEGHVFGAKPGGIELKLLPIIAHLNKFDASQVKVTQLDYTALLPSLLNGSVDFVITFYDSGAYAAEQAAAKAGKSLELIRWSDFGLDTYGDSIVATNKLLKEKPDMVRRFLNASMQGFVYAADHPTEVPDIVLKFAPTEEPTSISTDWTRGLANLSDDATKHNGLGWIDAEKFKRTKAIALQAYSLSDRVPDSEMFTNEFLPGPDVNLSTR